VGRYVDQTAFSLKGENEVSDNHSGENKELTCYEYSEFSDVTKSYQDKADDDIEIKSQFQNKVMHNTASDL